jgi:hypothetical protein
MDKSELIELLLAVKEGTIEPNEAAVIKMRLQPSDMKAWIDDPAGAASDRKHNSPAVQATKKTPDDDI